MRRVFESAEWGFCLHISDAASDLGVTGYRVRQLIDKGMLTLVSIAGSPCPKVPVFEVDALRPRWPPRIYWGENGMWWEIRTIEDCLYLELFAKRRIEVLQREARREEMRRLRSVGWTFQRIADHYRISSQRVQQILRQV